MIKQWRGLWFEDGTRLAGIGSPGEGGLPLVEVELLGWGRAGTAGKRHVDGLVSRRLVHAGHEEDGPGLVVRMADPATGLNVAAHFEWQDAVLRSWAEVTATGEEVIVEHVSSFVFAGIARTLGVQNWETELRLWSARNPWSGEYRWTGQPLGLHDVGMTRFEQTGTKNRVALTGTGTWPTSEHLAMGWLEGPGGVLAWQIEHNGGWHVELGDRFDEVYLTLSGPSQREHQWSLTLAPGESFTTVPVALTLAADAEGALAALTAHRRATRRPHRDNTDLPVVFNDFMNCLMGDPTAEKLLPLINAAGRAGAEYFCIDAGWYDEERGEPGPGGVPNWWDSVGEWVPSISRFPNGLAEVTDATKAAGMIPGLWLEPEVIGVRSPLAASLPEEAFLRRQDRRIIEWGRCQLDLSHPAARAHLDAVTDRLIAEFGLGYLKLDYNVDIGPADGLLSHNRAFLAWLDALQDRHPDLVVEACASGGMRVDHATLSRVPVQSLTDQQDELLLPPIAVAAPTVVPPEQGAMWAYPQPDFDDERIAFSMITAMLGRIHLSGRLDLLSEHQHRLVADALAVYKGYRKLLATGTPRWPLGLPGWRDGWLALSIDCGRRTLLAVWRREAAAPSCSLPLTPTSAEVIYPADAPSCADLGDALTITLPEANTARLLILENL
jgi:alpha-galactosidase